MYSASRYSRKGLSFLLILFAYLLIYFQTFTADYAYLDEVYQLWENRDNSNLMLFLTQGRWLTGLLLDKAFRSISTIEDLKFLRLFSLGGWVLTTWLWVILITRWTQLLNLKSSVVWLSTLFVICGASTAICIGWASCMEMFVAVACGLGAGHVLFTKLCKQDGQYRIFTPVLVSLLLGIASLFFYQTAYGAFLLPFFIYFIKHKRFNRDRVLITGLVVYLLTYIVYFFLFKLSLQAYGVEASPRTGINLNILNKISFFFSGPIPQGFSVNWLYSSSNFVSQALYIVVFLFWVTSVFKGYKEGTTGNKIAYIAGVLVGLALIYLPLLIAKENFSSYRTLFVFNLVTFILLLKDAGTLIQKNSSKRAALYLTTLYLLATDFYNYNVQYINPLKKEYATLRSYFHQHYTIDKTSVHFVRAERKLFHRLYGTNVIKDEFGAPSTSRDWVPEPIIKQFITEMSGTRDAAARVSVVQYEGEQQYPQTDKATFSKSLLLHLNKIIASAADK